MKKFLLSLLLFASLIFTIFGGFINGRQVSFWTPKNPDAFCRDMLDHVLNRGHMIEIGGEAATIAALSTIANNSTTLKVWGNNSEIVFGAAVGGKVLMAVLADRNPTIYPSSWDAINRRTSGMNPIRKEKDLSAIRGLVGQCQQVWQRALAPQPVSVPQPVEKPQVEFELVAIGATVFFIFIGIIFIGKKTAPCAA